MAAKKKTIKKDSDEMVYVPTPEDNGFDLDGFEQVKQWVIANNDDTAAMDWLNKTTYPFTTRYEQRNREFNQGRFN